MRAALHVMICWSRCVRSSTGVHGCGAAAGAGEGVGGAGAGAAGGAATSTHA